MTFLRTCLLLGLVRKSLEKNTYTKSPCLQRLYHNNIITLNSFQHIVIGNVTSFTNVNDQPIKYSSLDY